MNHTHMSSDEISLLLYVLWNVLYYCIVEFLSGLQESKKSRIATCDWVKFNPMNYETMREEGSQEPLSPHM